MAEASDDRLALAMHAFARCMDTQRMVEAFAPAPAGLIARAERARLALREAVIMHEANTWHAPASGAGGE